MKERKTESAGNIGGGERNCEEGYEVKSRAHLDGVVAKDPE